MQTRPQSQEEGLSWEVWVQNLRELLQAPVRCPEAWMWTYHRFLFTTSLPDGKLLEGRSFIGLGTPVPYV